jgi:hypothetical protein
MAQAMGERKRRGTAPEGAEATPFSAPSRHGLPCDTLARTECLCVLCLLCATLGEDEPPSAITPVKSLSERSALENRSTDLS